RGICLIATPAAGRDPGLGVAGMARALARGGCQQVCARRDARWAFRSAVGGAGHPPEAAIFAIALSLFSNMPGNETNSFLSRPSQFLICALSDLRYAKKRAF